MGCPDGNDLYPVMSSVVLRMGKNVILLFDCITDH